MRAIAYCTPGELRLESRNLNEITRQLPGARAPGPRARLAPAPCSTARSSRSTATGARASVALQQRMHVASRAQARRLSKQTPVTYMIFDLLWLDGHSLMELPYAERRERLAALALDGEAWQTPEHVVGHGAAAAEGERRAAPRGHRRQAPGLPLRTRPARAAWIKIKTVGRQEFVIGGWLPGKGRRSAHDRRAAARRLRAGRDAPLRRSRRHRLQRGGARAPRRACWSRCGKTGSPFGAGERPPREAVFCEPRARRRGRVRGVDERRQPAPPLLQGPARGQAARARRPRGHAGAAAAARAAAEAPAELRDAEATALTIVSKSASSETALVDGRELKLSNSGKVLYPETGFTKRAADRLLRRDRTGPALAPSRQGR